MKSWFTAKAGNRGVAEIAIYDEIGAWGIRAKDFREALLALGPVSEIMVSINSPGGSVFDGNAIHNMLKRHKARVVVTVDGIAASIASVIAMAGDEIVMPENAMMMIHDPSSFVGGNSRDLRKEAEALDKIKPSLIASYRAKSGLDDDEIAELMAKETWLTAEDALAFGFADTIGDAVEITAKFDLSKFRNAPDGLGHSSIAAKEGDMPAKGKKAAAKAKAKVQPKAKADQKAKPTASELDKALAAINAATGKDAPALKAVASVLLKAKAEADQENPEEEADPGEEPETEDDSKAEADEENPEEEADPNEEPETEDDPEEEYPSAKNRGGIKAERQRAADIVAACNMAGQQGKASGFIASGKSISEVLAALRKDGGKDDDTVTTRHQPQAKGDVNAKAGWDKAVARINGRVAPAAAK